MATVRLENISKTFPGGKAGEVNVVSDVSFEVAHGEFAVLAGPPGSGKTTVLRMIAGLEAGSRGDIFIGDRRVNDVPPKDRDTALVFHDFALYPQMSVYDNIAFGLKRRKFSEAEIKKRVQDAASILEVQQLLDRKPPVLSHAQRLRVALGRAIVRQPKVLLFDQPLAALDATTRAEMRAEIARLHQRLEATVIYVTQDWAEAMTMADRIVLMDRGAVQQNDMPLAVYQTPANLFVAGFIGSPPMNIVQGTLKQERDVLLFREAGGGTIEARFNGSDRPVAREFAGKSILLGIRPEAIQPTRAIDGRPSAGTGFAALVELVQPAGAHIDFYLQTGAHTLVSRSRESAPEGRVAGRRMRFELDLTQAHLFDSDSKRRVV